EPRSFFCQAEDGIRDSSVTGVQTCALPIFNDLWAFSGLEIVDRDTGEVLHILVPASDENMLYHYGINDRSRVWRTVIPAALPERSEERRVGKEGGTRCVTRQ